MRNACGWTLVLTLLLGPAGCTWLDYQETKLHSTSLYHPVDAEAGNFGYQRLMINRRYREPVDAFVQAHGNPDWIFEYNQATREGIRLYYLEEDRVYDFLERGASPNSATLLEERPLTSFEKARIKELQERKPF